MHFRVFDCWRLTAAILVMAYHFLFYAPYGVETGTQFLRRLLPLLDMFFMISGFLIASRYATRIHTTGDYANFMRRRIARLYPLHFLTTMFFVGVAVLAYFWGSANHPWARDVAALPFHLLALHALGFTEELALNYPSWSVSAEFFAYALFPLIVLAFRWKGLLGLFALLAVWLGGLEYASTRGVFPSGHWTDADTLGAYRAFADFIMGAIIAVVVARRMITIESHWPGIILGMAAAAAMILEAPPYPTLMLLAAALTATALAETARPDSTAALAPLMPVTRVSFSIYLLHPVMEFFFLTVIWQRILEPAGIVDFYVFWIVPMIATVVVAMLSDRFVERRFGGWIAGPRPPEGSPARMASA
ncbi:acyltransferase [Aurantimonas sp. A2-1-M11]|uniref:acyltransferase family protein n=1 Tax=Aurantimonas sp. A2-1-M11 TaxID=3113712 RepID=UPI002F91CFCB